MNRIAVALSLMLGLLLSSTSIAAAQTGLKSQSPEASGYAGLVQTVLAADPEELAIAIQTPPTDADLPEGFTAPVDGVPRNQQLVDAFAGGFGEVPGAIGTAIHAVDTVPSLVPGAMTGAILTYMVVENEITDEEMALFEGVFTANLDSPDLGEDSSVERIDLEGVEVILANLYMSQGSAELTMQIVIAAVGNVMIVTTVISVDTAPIPAEDLLPFTGDLTIAGAFHVADLAAGI